MKCLEFPEVFDEHFYISAYPEARHSSKDAAYSHFMASGKTRGFAGSALAGREAFLAFLLECGFQSILEIGPGVAPSLAGKNVSYFDVRQGDEFHEYARQKGVTDFGTLPQITYCSPDGSLKGVASRFDLVFSSHCIEHSFDIVDPLNDVYDLLLLGGVYCLVVPDKRFTFDYFKHLTSVTDIIYRHSQDIPFHPLKPYLDVVYETHNDWLRHWRGDHGGYTVTKEALARQAAAFAAQSGRDPGLHAWIFTDSSFHDIFTALYRLGVVKLRPHRVFNVVADANSFCVVLKKD